jgi:hypothetical protein
VEESVQTMGGAWQRFLGTVADGDGQMLKECTMCDQRLRDMIYMPCGHFVACRVCAEEWAARVNTCPICRKDVVSIESVRQHERTTQSRSQAERPR